MSMPKNVAIGILGRHLVVFLLSPAFFSNPAFSLREVISLGEEAEARGQEFGSCGSCHGINRPDPLHHLMYYHGGYDVRNTHYWASAAFTGVHGYAAAGVWILFGVGFGLFLLIKKSRVTRSRASAGRGTASSNLWLVVMFSVIILFTLLAIVASSLVLAANRSSLHRTDLVKKSIIGAGKDARRTIRKTIQAMTQMQDLLLPFDPSVAVGLNITAHRLRKESRSIQQFIEKTDHSINLAIDTSYLVHLVIVVADLLLLLAAFFFSSIGNLGLSCEPLSLKRYQSKYQSIVTLIIIICWIITALCWAITGFDFFFHSFAEDTCSAFRDFVQNPDSSSLSSILPCINSTYANQVLVQIGSTIYDFVQQMNMKIAELLHFLAPSKQSESLGVKFQVCQPFSGPPDYTYTGNCSESEIPISQVPQVLTMLTCYKNESSAECARNGKFLSEGAYNITWAISTSIDDLLRIYPDLQNLSECSFVKERLRYIVSHQCRPFRSSIRKLWASMLSLSIFMLALVLLWVAKAYQDRGKSFSKCSIFP